jgi:glycosyltransferase involved in cell wall biosynthesis
VNILIDATIFHLQSSGGISTIWRELMTRLPALLPDCTFDPARPADIFIPTYYSAKPAGSKSVVMVYDWITSHYPGLANRPDRQWQFQAVQQADAVIAISQWTADDTLKFTGKTAAVAYPATSLERASHEQVQAFKTKYNLPEQYVLIAGRRDLYKNVNSYWQALGLMRGAVMTVCVGGEPDSGQQRQPAVYLRLPASELSAAYTGALCLVYPSLYEGFGLPVLEAYACGCPVICGNGGALSEINSAALVVDVTKPREIAEALVKLHDPGVRINHILKGYEVIKQFSWQRMAESVAAVIKEVSERASA